MMDHAEVSFFDFEPRTSQVLREVLVGLSQSQKSLPPKYLYDQKGSEIFKEICELEDYYPTRTERRILETHAQEIAHYMGEDILLIEPGSGAAEKVRIILDKLDSPRGYVPVEISKEILLQSSMALSEEFPSLDIVPVCADFTLEFELPMRVSSYQGKKVIFFPGSTIGNLNPREAIDLLKHFSGLVGSGGGLLIGVDVKKDAAIFKRAYDDSKGVTAMFNLNLLERLNREVLAQFEKDNFEHVAFYNEEKGRVEMHLRSKFAQLVRVNQTIFRFNEGETIHTESSYKYHPMEFCELAAVAKFQIKKMWMDSEKLFCVYYFERD